MKEIYQPLKFYLIILFFYFLIAGIFLLFIDHGDLVLLFNQNHAYYANMFFKYWTWLGDGILLPFVVIFLCFIRYYYAIIAAIAFLLNGIVVQFFKRVLYQGEPRPKTIYEKKIDINQIDGVNIHGFESFPSGHTADGFVLAIVLAFVFRNQILHLIFFIMAFLVAFSRIYLFQHFFVDTYFGALIGSISGLIAVYLAHSFFSKKLTS